MRRLLAFSLLLWLAQLLVAASAPSPLELIDTRASDADLFEPGGLLLLEAVRLIHTSALRAAASLASKLLVGQFLIMVISFGVYWAATTGLTNAKRLPSRTGQATLPPPGHRRVLAAPHQMGPLLRFVLASQLALVAQVAYAATLAFVAMLVLRADLPHDVEFALLSSALLLALFMPLFVLLDLWRLELAAAHPLASSLATAWSTLSRQGWSLCAARFTLALLLASGPLAVWLIAIAAPSAVPTSLHLILAHIVTFGLVAGRALWLRFAATRLAS